LKFRAFRWRALHALSEPDSVRWLAQLLMAATLGCATVPPGQGAVVLGPSGVHPEPLTEGVSSVPWFGEVTLYDLRQQQVTVRFNALTSDGGLVTASASVVTYRIVPEELVALAREVGAAYAQVLVKPKAEAAVRQVVGGLMADELDSDHILVAQARITRLAAARLRPNHVLLESVDPGGARGNRSGWLPGGFQLRRGDGGDGDDGCLHRLASGWEAPRPGGRPAALGSDDRRRTGAVDSAAGPSPRRWRPLTLVVSHGSGCPRR
jgi:SPFH domain / Band 7 family